MVYVKDDTHLHHTNRDMFGMVTSISLTWSHFIPILRHGIFYHLFMNDTRNQRHLLLPTMALYHPHIPRNWFPSPQRYVELCNEFYCRKNENLQTYILYMHLLQQPNKMLSMNGSAISHNVNALLCASYKSIYFADELHPCFANKHNIRHRDVIWNFTFSRLNFIHLMVCAEIPEQINSRNR